MANIRLLYEILVPCKYNNGKPVRTKHHQEWDKVVHKIAGGMTIAKPALGRWVDREDDNKLLYSERMIPVRIYCTEKQMKQIAEFTLKHYNQLETMVCVISDKVTFFKNDKARENQKTSGSVRKKPESDTGVPETNF